MKEKMQFRLDEPRQDEAMLVSFSCWDALAMTMLMMMRLLLLRRRMVVGEWEKLLMEMVAHQFLVEF